ncbi:P-loop containing nucleoside triphosphate hydrolase protein [Collybia nuda]|uniref:RNA helicase n=1 Tax=Collybia nuda TaxID=64659 RepID=A0A9P6CCB6_9AGAR|nr:P-loop containing nucleoside triphosphate hydrolase protein [Collybia nuda]
MLQAVRRSKSLHLQLSVLYSAAYHSSSIVASPFPSKRGHSKSNASRTRLSKDLVRGGTQASKQASRLEVAPRGPKPMTSRSEGRERDRDRPSGERRARKSPQRDDRTTKFSRDSVPHTDPNYVQHPREERNPSFRRRERRPDSMDGRTGRWGRESEKSHHELDMARNCEPGSKQEGYRISQNSRRVDRGNHRVESTPSEFYHPPNRDAGAPNATGFTSPPLMPGLLSCLADVLGPNPTPTPIQSLSLKWLLDADVGKASGWKQFLLASETGSGKSIAYLLPVLQNLKQSEMSPSLFPAPKPSQRPLNPRALILAPTHELARQLSMFAKSLLHEVKLRVLCASRPNVKNTKERDRTARGLAVDAVLGEGEFTVMPKPQKFPVDVVVGTPMKMLEMVRGRGWDRREDDAEEVVEEGEHQGKLRRGRDKMVGFGKWRSQPEMGLANVEWVVVDEADVLFDPDFQETTRQLLADISAARGVSVPLSPEPILGKAITPASVIPSPTTTIAIPYPFHLILTSATIPASLANYLDTHHPHLMRLASPNLHHLPRTLQTEYVNWSGGNKLADIERRIRRVWAEDASFGGLGASPHGPETDAQDGRLSKVLVFCNKSSKVDELGSYLTERGIKNVALTSTSEQRRRGSNRHLDGFLRAKLEAGAEREGIPTKDRVVPDSDAPRVMITTSLLSRGLDFSPTIRHVFIVDEPRNMVDFLHRAGRAGRAGERGKVVVFGKMKGRGSASAKDVRRRVGTLVA